jgi:predicted nucleotidyltransferase
MQNRLEIAKQYLDDLLHRRDDLVGATLTGSVARGQDTEFSDIDLKLITVDDPDGDLVRDGVDGWSAGIYIDAGLVAQKEYREVEAVLSNPFKASYLYEGLILYDPTDFLAQLQRVVRLRYLEPKWVRERQLYWVEYARTSLTQLCEGVSLKEPLPLCAGWAGLPMAVGAQAWWGQGSHRAV